ncbi:MAG: hypothetical protein JNM68_14200, partial [Dinghuibacter sp.]|nr:hypothetical protein [Dinghuibacter sp.]
TQALSAQEAYQLLDTLHAQESVTALEQAAKGMSEKVQLRVQALGARFLFYWLEPGDSLYAARMKQALDGAYALNAPYMIAEFSRWYGEMLNSIGNMPLAAQYCMNALKMQQELGLEYFPTAKSFYLTTAEMLYRTQNYPQACRYYTSAFQLPNNSIAPAQYKAFNIQLAHAYNAIGQAFHVLKKYDSSVYYLNRCMEFVRTNNLGEELYLMAYFNRFDPLLELQQYDSCKSIATQLWNMSQPGDSISLLGACFMHGRIALRNHRPAETLEWGLKAEQFGVHTPKLLFSIYKDLAAAYTELGQQEKGALYLEKWRKLDEENNEIKQKASAAFLEAESEFQKSRLRLVRVQAQRQTQVRNRNILLVGLALLAAILVVYINRRRKRSEKDLHEMKTQFHFFENRFRNAEEQLDVFKKEVAEKNRQIELLLQEKPAPSESGSHAARVDELSRRIILTEKDWEQFRESFNAVYPGFLTALKIQAPKITHAEVRMACLIRLNFDARHIAGMLGISPESVRKTRYRLKQRFNTTPEISLEEIIAAI